MRRRKMERMRRKKMMKMGRMRKKTIRGVMTSDNERQWFATRLHKMVHLLFYQISQTID